MSSAFARIAFTPNVRAVQARHGSREGYRPLELGEPPPADLTSSEIEFIADRDSFYQGTVAENGWPYVQHRGGPRGFLKVLGPRTLGYADFSGNRQYISVGNLTGDDRISLFLIDYRQQQRLKIWGRARIVDESLEPELIARLETPNMRAPIERGIVITVEAFDWNCPKYITPRYTEAQVRALALNAPRAAVRMRVASEAEEAIGVGPLALVVTGVRQLTKRIRAYQLHATDRGVLPPVSAGAHLIVPAALPDGALITRQYSLAMHPDRRDRYEIAVLREDEGRGGSAAIHAYWQLGTRLNLDAPINQFPLHADRRHAVLIAGGIGITPIKSMAHVLAAQRRSFELHYTGRAPSEMAYHDALARDFAPSYHAYFSRVPEGERIDIRAIVARAAPSDAIIYACGPNDLLKSVRAVASSLGVAPDRIRYENFD